jgi:hypothetical protein
VVCKTARMCGGCTLDEGQVRLGFSSVTIARMFGGRVDPGLMSTMTLFAHTGVRCALSKFACCCHNSWSSGCRGRGRHMGAVSMLAGWLHQCCNL